MRLQNPPPEVAARGVQDSSVPEIHSIPDPMHNGLVPRWHVVHCHSRRMSRNKAVSIMTREAQIVRGTWFSQLAFRENGHFSWSHRLGCKILFLHLAF